MLRIPAELGLDRLPGLYIQSLYTSMLNGNHQLALDISIMSLHSRPERPVGHPSRVRQSQSQGQSQNQCQHLLGEP